MDTANLKCFMKAYESKSFSEAAEKLFLTPQGLAKAVGKLESDLEVPLFLRSKRGIVPTPYAEQLYARACELEALLQEITAAGHPDTSQQTVYVPVAAGTSEFLTFDFVEAFIRSNPQFVLDLVEAPDTMLKRALNGKNGRIGIMSGPVNTDVFDTRYLARQRLCAVMSRNHPLAGEARVKAVDLDRLPVAVRGQEYEFFLLGRSRLAKLGVTLNLQLETSYEAFLYEFAARGLGVGFVLDHGARQRLPEGLVKRPLEQDWWTWDIFYVQRKGIYLTEGERRFREALFRWCPEVSREGALL